VLTALVAAISLAGWLLSPAHFQSVKVSSLDVDTISTSRLDILDDSGHVQGSFSTTADGLTQLKLGDGMEITVSGNSATLLMRGPTGQVLLGLHSDRAELIMDSGDLNALHSRVALVAEATRTSLYQETAEGATTTGRAEIGSEASQSYIRLWSIEGSGWEAP
jgi:hypothetical protein